MNRLCEFTDIVIALKQLKSESDYKKFLHLIEYTIHVGVVANIGMHCEADAFHNQSVIEPKLHFNQ